MALFTKKKLSDAERQAWSAQLLEVRAAELDRYGDQPTLGENWEEHDAEWNRLFAMVYAPQYGYVGAAIEMQKEGLRLSGYRKFVEGEAMLLLADELDDLPLGWVSGQVYWVINSGQVDDDGQQIWGFQFVAEQWKYARDEMKKKAKDWDLENTRKGLALDAWNRYFKWVALAILAIVVVIALVPVIGGVALGIALGETISITGALGAAGAAAGAALGAYGIWHEPISEFFSDITPPVDEFFVGAGDRLETTELIPVFKGNDLFLEPNAPTNPSALESGGLGAALLAAAALLLLL